MANNRRDIRKVGKTNTSAKTIINPINIMANSRFNNLS